MASSRSGERLSHEDWLRKKQLEEARKAGTAPAEVDEDGREINPHIPQYISQAPWYFGSTGPSLKHQRGTAPAAPASPLDPVVPRGLVHRAAATRYRKGACTNCGSMTHTAKECCERPRAVGARYTGRDIMPDEVVAPRAAPGTESYDAKRDRWAGYDPARHAALADFYRKVEHARKVKRAGASENKGQGGGDDDQNGQNGSNDKSDQDDDKEGFVQGQGFNDAPIQKMDDKGRATVRNLRIREDTAKYLRNLDPDSAYYDPKTRSMRDNPTPGGGNPAELPYAGDNYTRVTGDAVRFAEEQLFAYAAAERGEDANMAAAPSRAELLHRQHKQQAEAAERARRQQLLDRYGTGDASYIRAADAGADTEAATAAATVFSQTEDYVEYGKDGRVVGGNAAAARGPRRSKWEKDVFVNNHTSVWGSWWHDGHWGYACCHSLVKNSICTGEAGKHAQEVSSVVPPPPVASVPSVPEKSDNKEKEEHHKEEEDEEFVSKKRRKYNSGKDDGAVTEEQLEEYRRTRVLADDPMKAFLEEENKQEENATTGDNNKGDH